MITRSAEYILSVYQEKSFSRAAQKLFISQPALSAAIQKEEAGWGVTFFNRSSSPIELTPEGEYYVKTLQEILVLQSRMEEHFNAIRDRKKAVLSIGGAAYFCAHILPPIVQSFQIEYPEYRVNLFEAIDSDLFKYLQSDVIDLYLTVETPPASYESITVNEETVILAVPASYEINRKLKNYRLTHDDIYSNRFLGSQYPAVSIAQFKDEPFLLLRKGNDMYKRALRICRQADFEPNVVMTLDQLLTSYYVAASGKGIAFIRSDLIRYVEATKNLYFYKLDSKHTIRSVRLIYKKNRPLSDIAQKFIDFWGVTKAE